MIVSFTSEGWEDLIYWIETDRRTVSHIIRLIRDCRRDPHSGIGDPEPLRHQLSGWWSRRIDAEHRLVYRVVEAEPGTTLIIAQCRGHY